MKKSFKKAGAAVLSMAMLLAMGSVSMPVYAVDGLPTHQSIAPTQLAVTIANNTGVRGGNANATADPRVAQGGIQDDTYHSYYYLDDVDSAEVKMYRIATLEDGGWTWATGIKTAVEDSANGVESSFAKLLEKTSDGVTVDENGDFPFMSSDELQALAGVIQRTILSGNSTTPGTYTPVATQTINRLSDGSFETVYMPKDEDLFSDSTGETTRNVVGYYILITDPDKSGYVMQPVLVPISNKDNGTNTNARSVKTVALKGTEVDVDKDIIDIVTYTDANDNVAESFAEMDAATKKYSSRTNIDATKDLGVIDAHDVIKYRIMADVPVYSSKATGLSYSITDIPDEGIDILSGDTTTGDETSYNKLVQTSAEGTPNANPHIKVYYSGDADFSTTGDNKLLKEWIDYKVEPATESGSGNGFKISFDGAKLRGKNADGTLNTSSALYNAEVGDVGDDDYVAAYSTDMEGGHIFVEFYATTNDDFNSDWQANTPLTPYMTAANITPAMVNTDITDKIKEGALSEATITAAASKVTDVSAYSLITDLDSVYTAVGWTELGAPATPEEEAAHKATYLNKVKAALYLALSEQNRQIDIDNEAIKAANADKNGTKNVAKLAFNKRFTGGSEMDEVKDTTRLFAATLDLTKKALELKVDHATTNENTYLANTVAFEMQTATTTGEVGSKVHTFVAPGTDAKKDKDGNVLYLKANTTYELTTDPNEAIVITGEGTADEAATRQYVKVWEETTVVADAKTVTSGSDTVPLFIDAGNDYLAKTADTDVKQTAVPVDDNFVDNYAHEKVVAGAVFKLEEVYSGQTATTGEFGREGTNSGTHLRSYAITDANGKLKQLELDSSSPAATAPAVKKIGDATDPATNGDVVYVEKITTGDDAGKYNVYTLTTDDAWDRIGEGTYNLTEVQAPAGYKKWSNPAVLTIACNLATDTTENEENVGKFTATSTSTNAFWATNGPSSADNQASFSTTAGEGKDGALTNDILNQIDDTLPATGGIGTVLFTAGGISVVLIAGALFVMYMKKRNAEDEE